MTEFRLELVNKHLTISTPCGRLLIDTGSPLSFHRSGELELCSKTYNTPTRLLEADAEYLTKNVGIELDGLVGMDILSQFTVLIDVPSEKMVFGYEGNAEEIPSFRVMGGYAGIYMGINGCTRKVLVDTGAPIAYISKRLTDGLTPTSETTDFSPLTMTRFTTPLYRMDVTLDEQSFVTEFGHLPSLIETTIGMLGIDGVIGYDLLSRFPLVLKGGKFAIATE